MDFIREKFFPDWLAALALVLLLILTYWAYQFGFTGGYGFDDRNNLTGLSRAVDFESSLAFVFDGRAGVLGRPISLATFLFQKDDWPNHPSSFFLINTLIHLANGVLVFFLSSQLLRLIPGFRKRYRWLAITVVALWLTQPILVSTSLMAVQRMNSLSATFVFLGLIGYIAGRKSLSYKPISSYWLMTVSIVFGTALAALSKENGALLPLYALVIEKTLLDTEGSAKSKGFYYWKLAFLVMPLILLGAYFVVSWNKLMAGYAIREFSVQQRLLTESRVLWEYIFNILTASRSSTGPFQDDYVFSTSLTSPITTVTSIVAWVLVLIFSWWRRNKLPVIFFAVMWFFAGHVIESTVVPLELYFEHRNYIPSLGILLAICVVVWGVPDKYFRVALLMGGLIFCLRFYNLVQTTQLWGDPLLAGHVWAEEHPNSPRAVHNLAALHYVYGDNSGAKQITLNAYKHLESDIGLALQSVYLSCADENKENFVLLAKRVEPVLLRGVGWGLAPDILQKMLEGYLSGSCKYISIGMLHHYTDLLISNYKAHDFYEGLARLYLVKARIYSNEGKLEDCIRQLELSFTNKKELATALLVADAYSKSGHYTEALYFLNKAREYAPLNPFLRGRWKEQIDTMIVLISNQRQSASGVAK